MHGVACWTIDAATFQSKFVGESEKALAMLIHLFSTLCPGVLIFDEADTMFGTSERVSGSSRGAGSEHEAHLSAILQMLCDQKRFYWAGLYVVLITNREHLLPVAIHSRFTKKIATNNLIWTRQQVCNILVATLVDQLHFTALVPDETALRDLGPNIDDIMALSSIDFRWFRHSAKTLSARISGLIHAHEIGLERIKMAQFMDDLRNKSDVLTLTLPGDDVPMAKLLHNEWTQSRDTAVEANRAALGMSSQMIPSMQQEQQQVQVQRPPEVAATPATTSLSLSRPISSITKRSTVGTQQ